MECALSIGKMDYVVASETCAFDVVGAEFVRDVLPGELVIIDDDGLRSEVFARATSNVWNTSILLGLIVILTGMSIPREKDLAKY